MFGLDQYLLVEWLSAWLVLNWGAHLALRREAADGNTESSAGLLRTPLPRCGSNLMVDWSPRWDRC